MDGAPIIRKKLTDYGVTDFPFYAIGHALPGRIGPHRHDFFEIEVILSGRGANIVSGNSYRFGPGDVFLGNQFEDHAIICDGIVRVISIKFKPETFTGSGKTSILLDPFIAKYGEFRRLLPRDGPERQTLLRLCRMLLREYDLDAAFRRLSIEALLTSILIDIRRSFQSYAEQHDVSIDEREHSLVYDILAYFDEHYTEFLDLETMAASIGYSRAHLNRVFRSFTGVSLKTFLIRKRILFAQRLLESTGEGILDIAAASGFNDLSNFNRLFKAAASMSPREWRARAISGNA